MKLTMIKTSTALAAILAVLVTSLPVADANAASIRVKCETRANQSKVSVDGNNLAAGNYVAKIISGSHTKKSPSKHTVGDEVEFDFDSDPGNVAAGATRIGRNFIQGQVTGQLINEQGFTVAQATRACRSR
ncbi:hypothetical protein [Nitrosomonas sp.]|uniref:hypothetical protein n=1 Tax=Nitrosomonas sp. TaxID=42353 RepID=UPI0025D644F2|nr:hypothetical protein [Nitrosomonas sp.]